MGSDIGAHVLVAMGIGLASALSMAKLLQWLIDGSMGLGTFVCLLAVVVGFASSIMAVPSVSSRITLMLILLALTGVLYALEPYLEYSASRHYQDSMIERYRAAIAADSHNLAARSCLAAALYKEGRLEEAIAEYTALVKLAPNNRAEAARLRNVLREHERVHHPTTLCPNCKHVNPRERSRCEKCGAAVSAGAEIKEWLAAGGAKKVALTSGMFVAGAAGLVLILQSVPLAVRVLAVGGMILFWIAFGLVWAYRQR